MSEYPECDKLSALIDSGERDQVQGFLDWLLDDYREPNTEQHRRDGKEAGVCLAWWREKSNPHTELYGEVLEPTHATREALLYKFFDLDREKIETERRAMLDALQQ